MILKLDFTFIWLCFKTAVKAKRNSKIQITVKYIRKKKIFYRNKLKSNFRHSTINENQQNGRKLNVIFEV